MKINIKKLNDSAVIPSRGSQYAAGYDLYALVGEGENVAIYPHTTHAIGTGIAVEIPDGYFGGIYARSGLSCKKGLRPGNCVGVVDEDYRGEICVALHNDSDIVQVIHNGDRIAQLVIQPYLDVEFNEVNELTDTDRGDGGFGHTGR